MRRLPLLILIYSLCGAFNHLFALQGESIFVKAMAGGGYSFVTQTDDATSSKLSFSGITGMGFIQAGGSLNKSLKIFAFTGLTYTPKPSVKTTNIKLDTNYSFYSILDFGLGATYYLQQGLFISAGMSITTNYFKYNVYGTEVGVYTRHGWGANIMVGNDVPWLGKLNYGLALIGYYGQVYDVGPAADAPVTNLYFGVAGTVSYD
jgi:hypothetical protein